jgi:phenylalanyl-tRNA synthetase beta chain
MLKTAQGAERALISDVTIFDIYEGTGVAEDSKSVALAVTLQPTEKTLTDVEIEAVAAKIIADMAKKFGATLRG